MYVPSTGRGGLGSSSQEATGDGDEDEEDDDDDDVDKRHKELGPSQLHDAPSTHPTPPLGTRQLMAGKRAVMTRLRVSRDKFGFG